MAMYMMSAVNIKNNQVPNMGTKTRGSKYAGQSIKPLPIHILTVGKTRSPGVQLIVKDYIDRGEGLLEPGGAPAHPNISVRSV
ncbi:hypothetical protein HanPI659440_Chr14g0565381 [Helianthus annuus]|nr:hypothetical protein HanPI659440_Chr14g0565381 [Helianthus annuus]